MPRPLYPRFRLTPNTLFHRQRSPKSEDVTDMLELPQLHQQKQSFKRQIGRKYEVKKGNV